MNFHYSMNHFSRCMIFSLAAGLFSMPLAAKRTSNVPILSSLVSSSSSLVSKSSSSLPKSSSSSSKSASFAPVSSSWVPFSLGELKPEGWLKEWAQRAANGMTRNIGRDFTEFVRGWADPNQGGWWHYEQTAYYTDGFTRLGFLLDDTLLINRSRRVMEAVMARQKPNGYIHSSNQSYIAQWGKPTADYGLYWSEGIFCRAALAYYSATKDERVLQMLKRVYQNFPLFAYNTSKKEPFNGGDMENMRKLCGVENMFELTRITGDTTFASRALSVMKNYEPAYIETWAKQKDFLHTAICHGVSYNEGAKLPAIAYIWNGNPDYLAASVGAFEFMQENSMLPIGSNSSNEYLHGIGGFEATESCDITDFMWANIWLARATGDSRYGDRIERDAFNALPGAVSPSFTTCVYTEAPNRIPGVHLLIRDDGTYYKEMHWPTCCPANINRALPNYIMNMAMLNTEGDILWLTYGPAHLKTRDGLTDIQCATEYPFRDKLTFRLNKIRPRQVLRLRVPAWCEAPVVVINGKAEKLNIENGQIVLKKKWKDGDRIELTLPMKPELVLTNEKIPYYQGKRAPSWGIMVPSNGNMALDGFKDCGRCAWVNYGPLLFAMSMQRDNRDGFSMNEELWQEFRYGLTPQSLSGVKVDTAAVKHPFQWQYKNAPLSIKATANLIDWNVDKGDPTMPLSEPATIKKDVPITLIPYGFLSYRLSVFPLVGE